MEFERITDIGHPLYQNAIGLYKISFPPHEQREPCSQSRILSQSEYHFDVISNNGEFVGEILYWDIDGMLYIEHFCVMPSMRNHQYVRRILDALSKNMLILEIDPPTDEISCRRKRFYERCGFVENRYAHVHPPYHDGNPGHELVVMSSPRGLTQNEYSVFNAFLKETVMDRAY